MKKEVELKLVKGDKSNLVYADSYGNKHEAYSVDLFDYFHAHVFSPIGDLFNITEETEEPQCMGSIFRILIADASKKLDILRDLAKAKLGGIDIHCMSRGYPWYDDNLPLDMFLDATEKEETGQEGSVEKAKNDLKDFPSLPFLVKALTEGRHGIALGALKDLTAEIEKKQAGQEVSHG